VTAAAARTPLPDAARAALWRQLWESWLLAPLSPDEAQKYGTPAVDETASVQSMEVQCDGTAPSR
jgi:hypothetical protein